jgi:methylated-DNA-[protein]-cysteine S-methyltransferase
MRAWTEWQDPDWPLLRLVAGDSGLRAVEFAGNNGRNLPGELHSDSDALLLETGRQLRAYFEGSLREFDVPLEIAGTEFRTRVWRELLKIPYGDTRSYRDIATALGSGAAVRAVGAANGANPLAIVVPCHRVIGSNGKLVGYGGGLALKHRLLELERRFR